jgi:arginine repressor
MLGLGSGRAVWALVDTLKARWAAGVVAAADRFLVLAERRSWSAD